MYAGKSDSFDAVAVHLGRSRDAGARHHGARAQCHGRGAGGGNPPQRHDRLGVQYHPEYSLHELAAIVRRTGTRLVEEGFFAAENDLLHYADELMRLHREPSNKPLAWRHGIDGAVLDRGLRVKEVANWIDRMVLPTRSKRGRE